LYNGYHPAPGSRYTLVTWAAHQNFVGLAGVVGLHIASVPPPGDPEANGVTAEFFGSPNSPGENGPSLDVASVSDSTAPNSDGSPASAADNLFQLLDDPAGPTMLASLDNYTQDATLGEPTLDYRSLSSFPTATGMTGDGMADDLAVLLSLQLSQ
jgi:hypothetical protein